LGALVHKTPFGARPVRQEEIIVIHYEEPEFMMEVIREVEEVRR
jgi:hypothetical protein